MTGFQYKIKTVFDECSPTVDSPRLGLPWGINVLSTDNLSSLSLSDRFRVVDLDCATFMYPVNGIEQKEIAVHYCHILRPVSQSGPHSRSVSILLKH